MNSIHKTAILEPCILSLNFLNNLLPKRANLCRASYCHVVITFILTSDAIKDASFVLNACVEIGPELDQKEGVLRTLVIQLLKAPLLLRKLVIDLPDVHRLQEWVCIGRRATNVHKQVLVTRVSILLKLHEGRELDEAQLVGGDGAAFPGGRHAAMRRWQQVDTRTTTAGGSLGALQSIGLGRKWLDVFRCSRLTNWWLPKRRSSVADGRN